MSEIPEDILDAAEQLVRGLKRDSTDIASVAVALYAERERCAKIVASLATEYQNKSDETSDEVERLIFYNIAEIISVIPKAIRSHPQPSKKGVVE